MVCGESAPLHTEDCQPMTTGDVRSDFVFKERKNFQTNVPMYINLKFGVPSRAPI